MATGFGKRTNRVVNGSFSNPDVRVSARATLTAFAKVSGERDNLKSYLKFCVDTLDAISVDEVRRGEALLALQQFVLMGKELFRTAEATSSEFFMLSAFRRNYSEVIETVVDRYLADKYSATDLLKILHK